jgi:glycosyltransferase involved in cell wall biosynthesis
MARKARLNLAQIIYTGFGGLGSVAFSLIGGDVQREHDWAVGFIGDQELDRSYAERCLGLGVDWAIFRSVAGKPFRAWWQLARWLADKRPTAVILHSINSILPCRWYAWRSGAQLIAVEHTPNAVKTRREWVFSRLSMLLADRVVVLTPEYRAELAEAHWWLYRAEKVSVIANGIDTDVFRPRETRRWEEAGRVRLGMAARFSFSKRQDLLVAVLERLVVLRPKMQFELVFAGDGTEFSRVQQLAAASPLRAQVRFDGLLSEGEMPEWLSGLDLYVHATEGETLSTSLLQAMASALPIVASDIPGVRNLLGSQGEYGTCASNEVEGFARAIAEFIDRPEEARERGRRARALVCEQYSNRVMLQNYLALLQTPVQ